MIIHHSRITLVKKKKETAGKVALNRPPKMKGKIAKPKYIPSYDADEVIVETYTIGTPEEVMVNEFYLKRAFNCKKLAGKFSDYKMVKVEHLRDAGVTVDHYGAHPKPVEVLRPWPNPWPGEPGFDESKHRYKPDEKISTQFPTEQSNNLPGEEQRGVPGSYGSITQPTETPPFKFKIPKPRLSTDPK